MQAGTKGAELVKFFFALSEPIRLEIVRAMLSAKELCVCQIVQAFGLSQPKVSFHMRGAKGSGFGALGEEGKVGLLQVKP